MTPPNPVNDPVIEALDLPAPFHLGIMVRDLDVGMREYGRAFGIREWRSRAADSFRQPSLWHGEPLEGPGIKIAYSVGDMPFIELVQPTTDAEWTGSVFLREHGEGVYHLGYWVDDIEATLDRARGLGLTVELTSLTQPEPGQPIQGFAYVGPVGASGIRLEIISASGRERLLEWVRTGEFR